MGGLRLYRRCKTSESERASADCEVSVEGKEDIEGGEEMIGRESAVGLKRIGVSSRSLGAPLDIELLTKEIPSQLSNTDYTRDLSMINNPILQRI